MTIAEKFILTNSSGITAQLLNYGATLASFKIPTANNQMREITLGFDTLEQYLKHEFYFGCTVGRVANRIKNGSFSHQQKIYQLACNEKNHHHLHGGIKGFDKVIWQAKSFQETNATGVEFNYLSKDGEEGYPGNLYVKVTYTLTNNNELKINFLAQTDKPTPVNLTNHAYWNLAGAGSGSILNHEVQLFSASYLEIDKNLIPTGEIKSITDTAYDFSFPKLIGKNFDEVNGYDNCYVLPDAQKKLQLAARVRESNITMEVFTTQPGMQFYTGNNLRPFSIADNKQIERWSGFCLETQGFPDAINHPHFPTIMLLPNESYQHETIYAFDFS